jgi:uncharacterized protein
MMLDPHSPLTPWILGAALAGVLALMIWRAMRKDRREYARFKRYRSTARRTAMFRRWVLQSLAVFGGSSALLLLLAANFVPLLLADVNSIPWIMDARRQFNSSAVGPAIVIGLSVALIAGAVLGIVAARKETDIPSLGDVQALLPRTRGELKWGAALSINAGVVEELMFRLALPATIYGATGNATAAVVVSLAIFGLLHVYQGVTGVLASFVIGVILMAIYLASGSILLAIAVHAAFDLRSLVLIPVVLFKVHEVRTGNGIRPVPPPTVPAPESSA